MNRLIIAACFFIGGTLVCRADQPPCVGDRHDNCVVTTTSTTSTTLDPADPGCPDPPPCTPVVCGDGTTTNVVVNVNRCPSFPRAAMCRMRTRGHGKKDVLFQGRYYRCPRAGTPHRYWIPLP